MNIEPPTTTSNRRKIPPEFQQVLQEKSANFVGREFVFTAINSFVNQYDRGYFTIVGAPGSGKSAILAKYAIDNPNFVYYNAQLEGKNSTEEFLKSICMQIVDTCHTIPLHMIIQQVSNQLKPNQKFIIIIDALDAIIRTKETLISNLFCLPRYLPKGIYFLLSRRPFIREKSGLLIETPWEILDLENYPQENQKDMQTYIQQHLNQFDSHIENRYKKSENQWEFIQQLNAKSEHNFMFLSQILGRTSQDLSSKTFSILETLDPTPLPRDLEAYYQQHLQQMISKSGFYSFTENSENSIARAVLNVLIQQTSAISASAIAEYALMGKESYTEGLMDSIASRYNIAKVIDIDEYDVEEVLEDWIEFLVPEWIEQEICYSLYHSHFRKWLYKGINSIAQK